MSAGLHISISAEPVFHLGSLVISNSILTSLIVSIILVSVSLWAKANVKNTKKLHPFQNFLEMLIEGLYNLTQGITESSPKTKAIFPFVMGFFLFILLNNWLGLLPGVGTIGYKEPASETHAEVVNYPFISTVQASAPKTENHETVKPTTKDTKSNVEAKTESKAESAEEQHEAVATKFVPYFRAGTADLNTTLALAIVSVIGIQFIGIKFLGFSYFKKFFTLKGPIDTFVGILELVSEISKVISFAFRLFGNVFAGEVLLAVMAFLVPVLVPSVFLGLEIFVGAIQAFVFAMLTLVFMSMAATSHEDHQHQAHA